MVHHGSKLDLMCGGGDLGLAGRGQKNSSDLQIKIGPAIRRIHSGSACCWSFEESRAACCSGCSQTLISAIFHFNVGIYMYILYTAYYDAFLHGMCCSALRLRNGRTLGRCRFCSWHSLSGSSLQRCYGMLCLFLHRLSQESNTKHTDNDRFIDDEGWW